MKMGKSKETNTVFWLKKGEYKGNFQDLMRKNYKAGGIKDK